MKDTLLDSMGLKKMEKQNLNEKTKGSRWVEVAPHGLVGGMIPDLCLMVFKEKKGTKRFAMPLSQLQGQISLQQSMNKEEPFRFIGSVFSTMKIQLEKCYLFKTQKENVMVQAIFKGHPAVKSLNFKANDIIPFAVYSGCRFFCTEQFMLDMLDQKMERPFKKSIMRKPLYLN